MPHLSAPSSGRERHPEWFAPARLMFEEAFALIDLVGWATAATHGEPQICVPRHGERVKRALDSIQVPARQQAMHLRSWVAAVLLIGHERFRDNGG